ncbi:hypothetical protein F5Y01DRAFT_319662 [Xylaria sp. FL0043]|nr:hypothetical protein F5Y01DRAFT_319662 [Xylaria sp. FL0043]
MEAEQTSVPSREAVDSATKLYNTIREGFPAAVEEFESRWAAARAVCKSQSFTPATGDDTLTRTDQFGALQKLGPKIVPLVVFKLATDPADECSWAVLLYNALENDPNYRPKPLGDEDLSRTSQSIVELNYQRNQLVEERVGIWKEYCDENNICNHTNFLGMDEYLDLVEMGPSIIAHLMVQYRNSWSEAWFQLLHEINHGHRMVSIQYVPPLIFEGWCRWFNYGDQFNAPKYIPTALDRKIFSRYYGQNPALEDSRPPAQMQYSVTGVMD